MRSRKIGRRSLLAAALAAPALARAQTQESPGLREVARRAAIYFFPTYEMYRTRWRATVEHYYARHACRTPLFPRIAGEFAAWLAVQDTLALPGWAAELAHYESTQQSLHIEARDGGRPLQRAPVGNDVLAVSPLVRVLGYQWPVHEDGALEPVLSTAPTLLVIQRLADFSLQTEELSPLAYALLSVFGDDSASVDEALQLLSETHGVAADALRMACVPVLGELCAAGVLVALPAF